MTKRDKNSVDKTQTCQLQFDDDMFINCTQFQNAISFLQKKPTRAIGTRHSDREMYFLNNIPWKDGKRNCSKLMYIPRPGHIFLGTHSCFSRVFFDWYNKYIPQSMLCSSPSSSKKVLIITAMRFFAQLRLN